MSKIYDGWRGGKKETSWHLRIGDGSVYGPVTIAELRTWAEECRIFPRNEISKDQQEWIPAENLTELGMEWMVPLANGATFGPINMRAVSGLVRSGAVHSDANLTHKITGEVKSVVEILAFNKTIKPALSMAIEGRSGDTPPDQLDTTQDETVKTVSANEEQPDGDSIRNLSAQLDAARIAGETRARELEQQKILFRKVQEESKRQIQELQQQVADLQARISTTITQQDTDQAKATAAPALHEQIRKLNEELTRTRISLAEQEKVQERQKSNQKKAQDESKQKIQLLQKQLADLRTETVAASRTATEKGIQAAAAAAREQETILQSQVATLKSQVEETRTNLGLEKQSNSELLKLVETLKSQLQVAEDALAGKKQEETILQSRFSALNIQFDETRANLDVEKQSNSELLKLAETLKGQVQLAEGTLADRDQEIRQSTAKIHELQDQILQREQVTAREISALNADLQRAQTECTLDELTRLKEALRTGMESLAARDAELARFKDELRLSQDTLVERDVETRRQLEQVATREAEAIHQVQTLTRQTIELQLQIEAYAKSRQDLQDELQSRTADIEHRQTEWDNALAASDAREVAAARALEAIQSRMREAVEKSEQLEWDLQQRDARMLEVRDEEQKLRAVLEQKIAALEEQLLQSTAQSDDLRQALATHAQELAQQKKSQASALQHYGRLETELAQYKRLLDEEWARAQRRDVDLVATRTAYGEELARRQHMEAQLLDVEVQLKDARETAHLTGEELAGAQNAATAAAEEARSRQAGMEEIIAQLRAETHLLASRLAAAESDSDRARELLEEKNKAHRLHAEEWSHRLEEAQHRHTATMQELQSRTEELEQVRIQAQDMNEELFLKTEDLKSRQIQIQHENEGMALRLEQQKKFHDAEREQRRQREQELQQLKKSCQDLVEELRQKDRQLLQQRKLANDELTRLRLREERNAARVEQLQASYTNLVARNSSVPGIE